MSEQAYGDEWHTADDRSESAVAPAVDGARDGVDAPGRTGVARVDAALEALDRLDELPLEEHVSVFESAHAELRRALDADPSASPAAGQTSDAMARIAHASTDG